MTTFVVNLRKIEGSLQRIAHHCRLFFFLLEEEHVQIASSGVVRGLSPRLDSQLGGNNVLAQSSSSAARHWKVEKLPGTRGVGFARNLCGDLTVLVAFGAARYQYNSRMALGFHGNPSHDRRRCLGQPLAAEASVAANLAILRRPGAILGDASRRPRSRSRPSPDLGCRISQGGSSFLLLLPWIANRVGLAKEIVLGYRGYCGSLSVRLMNGTEMTK